MKFVAATLLTLATLVSAGRPQPKPIAVNNVPADSTLGMKILSKARRLDDAGANNGNGNNYWKNNNYNYNGGQNYYNNAGNQYYNNGGNKNGGYMDWYNNYDNAWANQNQQQFQNWFMSMHTWVKDYSIKFQGCHHVTEWNRDANDEEDVRIWTRRLVKFRLCPSYSCMDSAAEGCESGYGDYIIDLELFLMAYLEAREQYQEWMEQQAEENGYNYYGNDYGDWDMEQYMYCQESNVEYNPDDNQNYNYYQGAEGDFDGQLYMGPYCASQGGAVYIGLFTDEMCSQPVDSNYGRSIYYNSQGETMPFSGTSLVEMRCFPCSEPNGQYAMYNNQGDDAEDEDEVCEACETLYTYAGKCEENLPISGNTQNNKACNYLEGIKVIRKDGTVLTTNRAAGGSKRGAKGQSYKGAFAFVGIFSAAFVVLSAYVYYLKEKLDRASIQLAE